MPFRPVVSFQISIGQKKYRFSEHPAAKGMPYGQTGRRATVYQVLDENGSKYALKVFTQAFRSPRIAEAAARLEAFAQIPGLGVCHRQVLTREVHSELIEKYPDLQFAVLMPWVQGETWQEFMVSHRSLPFDSALTLAGQMTALFAGLEQQGLAHCDIAGPNVLVDFSMLSGAAATTISSLALVDVEEMYGPGLTKPEKLPAGTPGYDHKTAKHGLWSADADRFAGAVMLAEIMTRHDESIRQISLQEQYFDPGEMQQNSDRYIAVIHALKETGFGLAADLFARTWFSQTLSECPTFSEWYVAINRPASGLPVTWRPIPSGGGRPVSNPPISISLEQIKPMLLQAAEEGRWQDVINIAPQILQSYPSEKETLNLLRRAQSLNQLDQAIESLWQAALHSGDVDDWDICLRSIVRAQYQAKGVARYDHLHEEAEREREIAGRMIVLGQLVAESRWEEADEMRAILPLDHPKVAELFAQMDVAISNQTRLSKILKEARQAFDERNWATAMRFCREGLTLKNTDTELSKLLDEAQKERDHDQECKSSLERAFQQMDVQAVEAILGNLPQNHPLQVHGQNWLVQIRKTEFELEDARRTFDPERVQRILGRVPENFPRRAELAEWANQALASQQALLTARAWRNLPEVEKLLAELPAEHPARAGTQTWLEEEKNNQVAVERARQTYDLDRLADLLAGIPEDDAVFKDAWRWLKLQQQMAQNVQNAIDTFDTDKLAELLVALPPNYPYRKKLQAWQKHELSLRTDVQVAQNAYDLDKAQKLADSLPAAHPLRAGLDAWLAKHWQLATEVQKARLDWDFERVLALLETVDTRYPDSAALREWALQARERLHQADECKDRLDLDGLESLLAAWPQDDPLLPNRRITLADLRTKQQELAQLLVDAEKALAKGDFQQVEQLCQKARNDKQAAPRFTELAEIARRRLERTRQAEAILASARAALAQGKYAEALSLAANCAELEPENVVYSRSVDEMREKLFQMARTFEAKGKWDQAMKVWSALKQAAPAKIPLTEPVTQPEPDVLTAARAALNAGQFEKALDLAKEAALTPLAMAAFSQDAQNTLRNQAQAAQKAGQWEQAKQLWQRLKKLKERG